MKVASAVAMSVPSSMRFFSRVTSRLTGRDRRLSRKTLFKARNAALPAACPGRSPPGTCRRRRPATPAPGRNRSSPGRRIRPVAGWAGASQGRSSRRRNAARPCCEFAGDRQRQVGRRLVDLVGALLQPVLGQFSSLGAEGVGLDDIAAGFQVGGVDGCDHIGAGDDQVVVAAVVAVVVVGAERGGHDGRAHGAVEDEHLLAPGGARCQACARLSPGSSAFSVSRRKPLPAGPWWHGPGPW